MKPVLKIFFYKPYLETTLPSPYHWDHKTAATTLKSHQHQDKETMIESLKIYSLQPPIRQPPPPKPLSPSSPVIIITLIVTVAATTATKGPHHDVLDAWASRITFKVRFEATSARQHPLQLWGVVLMNE